MKQEEKQLLLEILCAMLPYNIICSTTFGDCVVLYVDIQEGTIYIPCNEWVYYFKPYLRPMSSMTEEEYKELKSISPYYGFAPYEYIGDWCPNYEMIDWLNSHHFDYRGLISKGLALEAPEGMYKEK